MVYLDEQGHTPGGQHAIYRALKTFLLWFEDETEPEGWKNPIRKVKPPKVPTEPLDPVEVETVKAMVAACPPGTLDNFCASLDLGGASPATVDNRLRAVRTMLAVAYRDGFLTTEQASRMAIKPYKRRNGKHVKPVGRRLSREKVRTLRNTVETKARNDAKAIRDRAILDTMLFSALRRFEVANLRTSSFVQDGGRWWIVLTGKGDKTRRVKVHDTLYKSLAAWCRFAGLEIGQDDKPLFYNLTKGGNFTGNGKRRALSTSVVGRLVAEYGYLSVLAPETGKNALAAHDLRRTCACNAYDNGATVLQVQTLLGHSDPKTTIRYIGALDDEDNTAVDMVKY